VSATVGDSIAMSAPPLLARRLRLLAVCLLLLVARGSSGAPAVDENQLKAVFIYNFGKFVSWPAKAFKNKNSPIFVGVLGKTGVTATLTKAAQKGRIRGRKFEVRVLKSVDETKSCHILFVSQAESKQLATVKQKVRKLPVLLLSENPEFAKKGGAVGFVSRNRKVGLEFSLEAATQAGLRLSPNLLRVGKVVVKRKK